MTNELTTPDRAERVRVLWETYRDLHDGEIRFFIADLLHLADVDEHPGGGAGAVQSAVEYYMEERKVWEEQPVYLAQFLPAGKSDWVTVARGDDTVEARDVAMCMWRLMQKADLRTGEIPMHIDDLVRGAVVTADNGTAFRVIKNPDRQD
ncbi:hypothetical protein [Streptomyces triculaminicus]|uniref:hypothetical protein n=1 Tax=Streptomyces triculaminicus TaxID=2816232 RepID=UPI0037D84FFE